MGVQGLNSLLEDHLGVYHDIKFTRSKLVIDGSSLCYNLYLTSGLDQNHGGEYAAFEIHIKEFFRVLKKCAIEPYIVLDGGLDLSDKKVETTVKKAEARKEKAQKAEESGKPKGIFPKLGGLVFIQTLAQLEVKVAQCIGESDQEIAALACELKCPVLSADTDFCIFDLPKGFLPFKHFNWNEVELSNCQSFIRCRRFDSSSFCTKFEIKPELLAAFAALAGNDYVKIEVFDWSRNAPADIKSHRNLKGLFHWLKKFQSPQEALEEALKQMKDLTEENKKEREKKLQEGMKMYQPSSSYLSQFFLKEEGPCDIPALKEFKDKVPDWMLLPLTKAQLSGEILIGLLQGLKEGVAKAIKEGKQSQCSSTKTLPPAQGNNRKPSVNRTSESLRQVRYGLLMGIEKSHPAVEIDREDSELTSISVEPTFTELTKQLKLSSLNEVDHCKRRKVLLEALGTSRSSLISLTPQLQLPVAVTCYWMRKAQPPPNLFLLKILLLGISDGNKQSYSTEQMPDEKVNYAYRQWMICLKDSIYLNQLLNFPLPEPNIARLYQGTQIHHWACKMCIEDDPKIFLKNESSVKQYENILSSVPEFQKLLHLEKQQKVKAQERQKHEEEKEEKELDIAVLTENNLQLEEQILLKTRYRTKERHNKSNNPALARKEECRGGNLN